MLKKVSFVSAFIAALSGVLGKGSIAPQINTSSFPLSLSRKDRRAARYSKRDRSPGTPRPAGSKAVRIANV